VVVGVLVVLLGWLVPNPLPWRSPFEGGGGKPAATQAGGPDLAAGAEVAARTNRSVPAAAPTPPRPAGVPTAFRGIWHGHGVNFVGSPEFDTVVTFRAGTGVVATADFPSLGCQEVWQLRTSTPTVLTLQATLAQGLLCVQRPLRVQVTLLGPKRIHVRWTLADGVVESEATLTRVS
jgi:hypothetical protein